MSPLQEDLLSNLLPKIEIPAEPEGKLDPLLFWPDAKEVVFEIGFGGGEHLVGQARANRANLYLGAEPFLEGVAKAMAVIASEELTNVRLLASDARPVLKALTAQSLNRLVILFPDPWHKNRHNKRRLIQQEFLQDAHAALKPGGELRFASDWADYAAWTLEKVRAHGGFDWSAESAKDWRVPPNDHITTRYEVKKLGDCEPIFLVFKRI